MKKNAFAILVIFMASLFTLAVSTTAQSKDRDKPTEVTGGMIEGEGDGKGETVYYFIDVNKGDVKLTVDAKTDDRSTPLRVTVMDEDGKELIPIYVVATGSGKREVGKRKMVRSQRLIIKIATQDDPQVNHLEYKIRVEVPEDVPKPTDGTGTPPAEG